MDMVIGCISVRRESTTASSVEQTLPIDENHEKIEIYGELP